MTVRKQKVMTKPANIIICGPCLHCVNSEGTEHAYSRDILIWGCVQLKVQLCRRVQLTASLRVQAQAEQAAAVFKSHIVTPAYGTMLRERADLCLLGTECRHVAVSGAQASAEPITSPFGAQLASAELQLPAGACPAPLCSVGSD